MERLTADLEANHDFLEALMDKTKRRGLRHIARRTDEAKHAAAQTLLTLLSPSLQEEIKNHDFFKAERRAYRKDDAVTQVFRGGWGRGWRPVRCTVGQNQVILRHQKFTFPRARE